MNCLSTIQRKVGLSRNMLLNYYGTSSVKFELQFAGVEVQIGSEVDPLLELARVKEEREKVFGKKSNFLRRRGLDPYAGI